MKKFRRHGRVNRSDSSQHQVSIWLDGSESFESLTRAVADATADAGDYRARGVDLVLDGLDERPDRDPRATIAECRALVAALPRSRVIITSRPLGDVWNADEGLEAQTLTTEHSSGTYAAAKVHDAVRRDIIEADAKALAETITARIITPLVRFNFGADVQLPRFIFEHILCRASQHVR